MVILEIENSLHLHFLVSGHTKNVCDAAFSYVKRHLKFYDEVIPSGMMSIIEHSCSTIACVPGTHVQ